MLLADPYAAMTCGMRDAMFVGKTTLDGVETDHLAFKGKNLDWQVSMGRRPPAADGGSHGPFRWSTQPHAPVHGLGAQSVALTSPVLSFRNKTDAKPVEFRAPMDRPPVGKRSDNPAAFGRTK